jgi:transcriptional regulator with XRE-family HTH domain
MSRYHQRRRKFLENAEIAAGYAEMDSELKLIEAIDAIREQEGVTIDELARRMDRHREAISRLMNAAYPNPTLDTFTSLLKALDLTAEIHLRRSVEGELPITVKRDIALPA